MQLKYPYNTESYATDRGGQSIQKLYLNKSTYRNIYLSKKYIYMYISQVSQQVFVVHV